MNSTKIEEIESFCVKLKVIYDTILIALIHVTSFCLNLMCILVYAKLFRSNKIINKTNDLFKYLLVKSMVDTYLNFLLILELFFAGAYTKNLGIDKIYGLGIFFLIFGIYFMFSLELVSIMIEVAATFNRFRKIKSKFKLFDRIPFECVIVGIFVYSFGFYSYKFASTNVSKIESKNETSYSIQKTDLDTSMGYMHSIVRDGLCVLAIIVFNIWTMYEMKNVLIRKRSLTNVSTRDNIEKRLTLMVICMSLITIVGHGVILIRYFSPRGSFLKENQCCLAFSETLFWFSYQINFFLYYFFNLKFKKCFLRLSLSFLGKTGFKLNFKKDLQLDLESTRNENRINQIETIF